MIEHYVTLFDQGFLANGLALHRSLRRHAGEFVLWVLCLDDTSHDVLTRLGHPDLRPIRLSEVETPQLRSVRDGRTRAEYCWTLTPFTPDIVFDREPEATRATYIDADMWLSRNPAPIFGELTATGAACLITEHAYAPEFEQAIQYGIYCVQFMPFERARSAGIRRWWQDRVIEWCFAEPSEGRFGDQKYLDDWPQRFGADVHVLQERSWTQAPWNATRFAAQEAVTYHFHRLRTVSSDEVLVGLYRLPHAHVDTIYRPYLTDLRAAYADLAEVGYTPAPQARLRRGLPGLKDRLAFRFQGAVRLGTPYTLPF